MTRGAKADVGKNVRGKRSATRHLGCWCIIEFVAYYRSLSSIVDKGACQEKKIISPRYQRTNQWTRGVYTLASQILTNICDMWQIYVTNELNKLLNYLNLIFLSLEFNMSDRREKRISLLKSHIYYCLSI